MSVARFFGNKPFSLFPLTVGGVECTAGATAEALECLRLSPGLMIRQPLARIGSPLAACDYHAAGAPYRARFEALPARGRGAAGRGIAKLAFCQALAEQLAALPDDPVAAYEALTHRAWLAFAADPGYVVAMARAGAAVRPLEPAA